MKYNVYINPCKACSKKYENEGCSINSMNNCVFETSAAFANIPSLNAISTEGTNIGEQCIANIRNKMGPFPGWYKNRKLSKPAIFIQEPHYLPKLLQQGYDVETARNMCIRMCTSEGCIENCNTDADAVEYIQPENSVEIIKENYDYVDTFNVMDLHYQKPIELDMSYYESLRLAKPYIEVYDRKISGLKLLHYVIPPLNTDIRFTSILKSFNIDQHPGLLDVKDIPIYFNWRNIENSDSIVIKNKKSRISIPSNQGLCGSCWSVSTADIISDNFVVSDILDYSPKVSATWALSCYSQYQCDGGNPAILLEDISRKGIASDNCLDYSWCSKNAICNNKDPNKNFNVDSQELNKLVPKCGCSDNKNPQLYFIEPNSQTIYAEPNNIENIRDLVKKHILSVGPVLGGFVVFNNFMKNKSIFTKVNGGVYLENGIYDDPNNIKFSTDETNSSNYIGSHAVAIIGWGIEKNIIIDNNGNHADVPYWYCRNSWGIDWGDGGYFKMAMYPYNKTSQFDVLVKFKNNDSIEEGGGIILIKPKKSQVNTTIKFDTSGDYDKKYNKKPDKNPNYTILYIGLLFIFILSIFFFIKYNKKKN